MLPAVYPGRWIVLAGVLSLMLSAGATMYVLSVLVEPMERELGRSRSLLYGAVSVSAVVTSIVSGVVGTVFDRHGARTMMAVSSLVSGAAVGACIIGD